MNIYNELKAAALYIQGGFLIISDELPVMKCGLISFGLRINDPKCYDTSQ